MRISSSSFGERHWCNSALAGGIRRMALLISIFSVGTSPALAGTEIVAGWEGTDTSDYAFVSPSFSTPVRSDMDLIIKPAVNYLRYEERRVGEKVVVKAPGASLGVGVRLRRPSLTMQVGAALEWIHRKREPANGPKKSRGNVGVAVNADLYYQAAPGLTANAAASYSDTNRWLWSRAGLAVRVTNRDYSKPVGLSFGPEVSYQAGHSINEYGAGAMAEIAFERAQLSLQLRGGYSRTDFADGSHDSSPRLGVSLFHRF